MNIFLLVLLLAAGINPVFAQPSKSDLSSAPVAIPGGSGGIGFDDMIFSPELHKVLVPAGHTGKLYLIDPLTYAMSSIGGFTSSDVFKKGHEVGISSVDENNGFVFVPDHGAHQLDVVNLSSGTIVAKAPLAGDPDFVRYVSKPNELWVTEPDNEKNQQIEVFQLGANDSTLVHKLDIAVPNGPESLTIDQAKAKAYTNVGQQTAVIDVTTHTITASWPNSCAKKGHGTDLDTQHGFLFVACGEGKAVVLDTNNNGKQLGSLTTGAGVDLVDYNPGLSHLYVPASKNATLSIIGVSAQGQLSLLNVSPGVQRGHCIISDDQNNIWVCDPKHGQLLRYKDTLAASK